MQAPIKGSMNESSFLAMVDAVANTTVVEFIEDESGDLSAYGLDKPVYEVIFSTEKAGEMKLQFGLERKSDSSIYAKLDGVDEVYAIDLAPFTFLDKPLKEIVSIFAYIVNIDQVERSN